MTSKLAVTDFNWMKEQFLEEVVVTVKMEEIPHELIMNWDQMEIMIVQQHLDNGLASFHASGSG